MRRCGHCGEPLLTQRSNAVFCSREHKEAARQSRKRRSDRVARLRGKYPHADAALADAGDVDLGPMADTSDDDDAGSFEGGYRAPDPWEARNAAFNDQMALMEAIERIEADFDRRARPYLDQQRRNPGPLRPELAALARERDAEILELTGNARHAAELERAARLAPQRQATAQERQVQRSVVDDLCKDLRRHHFVRAEPEPAGRDVWSTWNW